MAYFPIEIWIVICDQLSDETSLKLATYSVDQGASLALGALCRVSKGIGAVAQRALFKRYDLRWYVTKNDGDDLRKHLPFLRTILDSPRLASFVKEVSLTDPFEYMDSQTEGNVRMIHHRIAARLGFDPIAFLLKTVERGRSFIPATVDHEEGQTSVKLDFDTLLFLVIIHSLHNLESLFVTVLQPYGPERQRRTRRILEISKRLRAIGVMKPFRSIKNLTLRCVEDGDTFDLLEYEPLLALTPNIETLRLRRCLGLALGDEAFLYETTQKCLPKNIKVLEIRYGFCDDEEIQVLLRCCPHLERFAYHATDADIAYRSSLVAEDFGDARTKRKLIQSLLHAKESLKEVDLDYRDPFPHDDEGEVTLADFAGFAVLEKVHIDGRLLQ